jgi:hypothetical protein
LYQRPKSRLRGQPLRFGLAPLGRFSSVQDDTANLRLVAQVKTRNLKPPGHASGVNKANLEVERRLAGTDSGEPFRCALLVLARNDSQPRSPQQHRVLATQEPLGGR